MRDVTLRRDLGAIAQRFLPLVVLAAAAGAAAQPGAPPPAADYVDDRQCAACHRALYRSYQHVGMARSFSRPDPQQSIETFGGFHHEPSQRHYEMRLRDGDYVFTRYQLDDEGSRINVFERKVDWIIGSGAHSRGYLYQNDAGELYQLPVAWYTQIGRFAMAPGYDHPDHDGVTRRVTRQCMFCHNAYPRAEPAPDGYGQPQVFPDVLPEGTGCQRCHGPGGPHVRLAQDLDAPLEEITAAIVNPARLPAPVRDDVCYQCHLQPTSRRTSLVQRFGRDEYAYRPGQPLSDHVVHLDFDGGDHFEINHHPYRLRQSACYRGSDGRLNCLTCHDPHRKVPPEEAAAHYRAACLTCHDLEACGLEAMHRAPAHVPAGTASDDCVTCHMPRRRTEDVIHVVMTDHRIQARIEGDPLAPRQEQPLPPAESARLYFPDRAPPQADLYALIARTRDGSAAAADALAAALAEDPAAAPEPYVELGAARLRGGAPGEALNAFAFAMGQAPDLVLARVNAAVTLSGLGRHGAARRLLEEALQQWPDDPDARYDLAAVEARLGNAEAALRAYREALRLRPTHAKARLNLGNLHARAGRFGEAAEAYRRALAVEPDLAAAWKNLGLALRREGAAAEALRVWRSAFDLLPQQPEIALELAAAYLAADDAALRDDAAALRYARAAAALAPDSPDVLLVLAAAQALGGEPEQALRTTAEARRLGGDEAALLLVTALAHDEAGNAEQARAARRRALALGAGDDDEPLVKALRRRAERIAGP